jgi:DNA ligase-1
MLAAHFNEQFEVSRYWVSEKYDGARAWWNGRHFVSRGGNIYQAPDWFTANLPNETLDGELWIGRNRFQRLMQTIRDQKPDDAAWRDVKFMVFDAPDEPGHFSARQNKIASLLADVRDTWIQIVPQRRVHTHAALQSLLREKTATGAEGLMLQREDSVYFPGRNNGLLKMKTHSDAEATVLAYRRGKGKYSNVLGSLLVQDKHGVRFRIGSGFSDDERRHPPPIGSTITFRYQGKTNSGKPRFARFLRIRPDE